MDNPTCATCKARNEEYSELRRSAEPTKDLGRAFCQECGEKYHVLVLASDLEDESQFDDGAAGFDEDD